MAGNDNDNSTGLDLAYPGVAGYMGQWLSPSLDLFEKSFEEFGKSVPKDSAWQGVLPDSMSGLGIIGKGAGPLFELGARAQDGISNDDLVAVTGGFVAGEIVSYAGGAAVAVLGLTGLPAVVAAGAVITVSAGAAWGVSW